MKAWAVREKAPHEINYPLVMTNIAIENDHRNCGFSLIKNGGSFHSYVTVYQRVYSTVKDWVPDVC